MAVAVVGQHDAWRTTQAKTATIAGPTFRFETESLNLKGRV
jgi:hypothetical protein